MAVDLRDKFRGALLGTALGDSFGAPLEGASGTHLPDLISPRAGAPGTWRPTDDTQMMLDVAEWLLARSEDPEALLARLAEGYDAALGYGHGTKQALHAYRSGRPGARARSSRGATVPRATVRVRESRRSLAATWATHRARSRSRA